MKAWPGFALCVCVCVFALLTSGEALVLRVKTPNALARKEANLECNNITIFAAGSLKYPESLLNCVANTLKNVSSAKTHQYNFQGALEDGSNGKFRNADMGNPNELRNNSRRHWVLDFAKDNFADNDMFFLTDMPAEHVAFGAWDHTGDEHEHTQCGEGQWAQLDTTYYKVMAQSNFTLCPGGDYAFSHRFYQAIMAGSIPVIHSVHDDVGLHLHGVGYTFFMTDEVVNMKMSSAELKRIADSNYELFMKYQTFVIGDNVPPSVPHMRGSCSSPLGALTDCMSQCESMNPTMLQLA